MAWRQQAIIWTNDGQIADAYMRHSGLMGCLSYWFRCEADLFFCQICKEHQLINDTSSNDKEHHSVKVTGADVHNGVSNNITSNQHLIQS